MLDQLPAELIDWIFEQLPRKDIANIAKCSRILQTLATPALYRYLVVPCDPISVGRYRDGIVERRADWNWIKQVVDPKTNYARHIRAIRVTNTNSGPLRYKDEPATPKDEPSVVSRQVSALLDACTGRVNEINWCVTGEDGEACPTPVLRKILQMQYLSSLSLALHPSHLVTSGKGDTVYQLAENSMPALRRLTLEIEWHLHTIQAHYILNATPNLQKLTLRGAHKLYNGQKERLFRRNFSSHASDIGFDGKTVELEHLLEFCVFKNIAKLKIRKLKLFRFVLSEQMMGYVQPEELRYLQIQNCQTPSGTLSTLRPEKMQLHTFRFMYKNFRRDYQIYFDFIGQLKPGLQQLICGIVVMHRFYNPEVQIELTRRLPLPFGFAEKHGDTLKYFCYHLGGKDGPTYLPDQDSEDIAPTGLWNLRELSLPLKTQKAINIVQPDYAEGEEWKSIQQPVSLTVNKLDGLNFLYSLTFSPISDHYRISVLDTILNYVDSGFIQDMESGYPKPRDRRNSLMVKYVEEARLLQDFVGEVATFYGCQFPTAAGPPTLKWISFLSGYQLSEDKRFGYKVEWTFEENSSISEKYTPRVIFVRDADTQMELEGLELRTPKIDLGGARLFS